MKRILTLIALCIVSGVSASTRQLQIIPQPVKAELRTGVFVTAGCRVEWEGFDIRPENLAALTGRLVKPCHPASTWNGVNAIVLRRDTAAGIPAEGYRIDISARRAQLSAGDDAGLFYGLQTPPPTGRRTGQPSLCLDRGPSALTATAACISTSAATSFR